MGFSETNTMPTSGLLASATGKSANGATAPLVVRQIMTGHVVTVRSDAPVSAAARLMREHNIRHLVVLDGSLQLAGILSNRDVLQQVSGYLARGMEIPGTCTVADFMVKNPATVLTETPLTEAAALMASRKIGCLPVLTTDHRLAGIVSVVDILRFVAGERGSA